MSAEPTLLAGPDADAATERAMEWAAEAASERPGSVLWVSQSSRRADDVAERWRAFDDQLRLVSTTLDEAVSDAYERAVGAAGGVLAGTDRRRLVEAAIERYDSDGGPLAGVDVASNALVDEVQGIFSLLEYAGYATSEGVERGLYAAGVEGDERMDDALYGSFREGGVSFEELRSRVGGDTAALFRDVAGLYAEYERLREETRPPWERLLAERYRTLLDGESSLASHLPESVEVVVFDGLTRLAPVERAAVAELAEDLRAVAVLPLVHESMDGVGVDDGVRRTLRFYRSLGFELDYGVPADAPAGRIRHARRLYRPPSAETESGDERGVEIVRPATEREEVRTTARRVRQLLARDDVKPSDVGVVVTDRATYRSVLAEVLTEYGVPFTFVNDIGIEQTAVGDAVLALLDLAEDPDEVTALRRLASNSAVSLEAYGIDRSVPTDVLSDRPDADFDTFLERARERDAETADGVERLVGELRDRPTLEATVEAVERAVEELDLSARVESVEAGEASMRAAYESSALRTVEGVLSSLSRVAGHVSDEDPVGRVRRAVLADLVTGPRQRRNYVRVLPLAEAEMESFDHAFVLGLADGYFPSEADAVPFEAVNEVDEEFGREHRGRRARYLLSTLVTGSENVVLSSPDHTIDGAELLDAPILAEWERQRTAEPDAADSGAESDAASGTPALPIAGAEDAQRRFAEWAAAARFDDPSEAFETLDTASVLDGAARRTAERGMACAWRRSRPELTGHDAQLGAEALDTLFPTGAQPYSPSVLETYAECPFVYFVTEGLGFEEYPETGEGLTRGDVGNYVHAVLGEFYRSLRSEPDTPVDVAEFDRETLESELLAAARNGVETLDGYESLADATGPFERREFTRLLAGLGDPSGNPFYAVDLRGGTAGGRGLFVRFLDEELDGADGGTAGPAYFEAGLGVEYDGVESLAASPVSVQTPEGPVELRGVADRIDVDPDSGVFDVRDYKTGSAPSSTDVTGGTALQLPLYGLAFESVLSDRLGDRFEAAGGSYYELGDPTDVRAHAARIASQEAADEQELIEAGTRPWYLPFETREEHSRFVRAVTPARLGAIDAAVSDGAFHPTLLDENRAGCEDCTFRDVCAVRNHHRLDTIAAVGDDPRYVPERATGEELSLDRYPTEDSF